MAAGSEPLATSALLADLTERERAEVVSRSARRSLGPETFLFHQGERALSLYVVEAGRLRLSQVTADGQEVVLRLAGAGEAFAAIAVLDQSTYPFSAQAIQPSTVRSWDRAVLRELFSRVPRLELNVLKIVGAHTRDALDRFRELATEAVPRRLSRALLRLVREGGRTEAEGVWLEGVTQRDLADMAATTLYTVSRILSQWQAEGTVRTGRGRILVRSTPCLERIAEGQGSGGAPDR